MLVLPILFALASFQCEENLKPAISALQQNDVTKASSILQSVQSGCSQSSAFFGLVGIVDEMAGQQTAAEDALRKAISLDPTSARLREQLGAIYLRHQKSAEAADQLTQAVALDPQNPVVKKYLIGAYVESGEWKKAVTLFDQIGGIGSKFDDQIVVLWFARTLIETKQLARVDRDLPPEHVGMSPALLFSLGTLFAQHGLYVRAIEYFHHIPTVDTDDAVSFNLGLCYSHLENISEARKSYFAAIDKHPGHVDAYFHIGLDYGSAGQGRMAIPWLLRAHEWAPNRADIAYALVEQLIQLQYFDTAREVLTKNLGMNQNDPLLLVADGDFKQATGDTDAAIQNYQKVLKEHPGFPSALVSFARAEVAKGKDEQAQALLQSALSTDLNNGAAVGELGMIEARLGANDLAVRHLKMAWTENKADVKMALELSRVYRRLGQPTEALKVLVPLEPMAGDSPALHLELAQTYGQLQRAAEADAERKRLTQLQMQAQGMLHFDSPKTYVH